MDEERPVSNPGAALAESVRGSALSLLLSGGVCLYFGLTLIADAPGSASPADAQRWFAADHAMFWGLRGLGIGFLVTAALAALGQRVALLLATIAEALFALLMLIMTVAWTLEARVDGMWNYQVILLLVLAMVSVGAAQGAWRRWRATRALAVTQHGFDDVGI